MAHKKKAHHKEHHEEHEHHTKKHAYHKGMKAVKAKVAHSKMK